MKNQSNYYLIESLAGTAKIVWYFYLLLVSLLFLSLIIEMIWDLPFNHEFLFTMGYGLVESVSQGDANNPLLSAGASALYIDSNQLSANYPGTFALLTLLDLITAGIIAYGIFQLKELLRYAAADAVFTMRNIYRVERIAYLFFLLIPGHWLYQKYVDMVMGSLLEEYGFKLASPYLDFSFAIYGCLILTLAEVFKRGRDAYQEQKLTV